MSLLKKVADFLGGKDPDIFDDKGRIAHKLAKKKWDDWSGKYVQGSEYNWRNHKGSLAGAATANQPQPSKTNSKN